jgi:hypothetical protein
MFIDMEAFEHGDRSGEHLQAYRSERTAQGIGTAAGNC